MSVTVLLGLQWGDEGKGKMVDLLAEEADCIARFQGGNNAGHTVSWNGTQYIFHLIPSGILHPDKICVIGNGVVVDPEALLQEIDYCTSMNLQVEKRLFVSQNAHLILPYHRYLDIRQENGTKPLGTTRRGIGPAYADKINRTGLRVGDLLLPDFLQEELRANIQEKEKFFAPLSDRSSFDFEKIFPQLQKAAEKLQPYITDTIKLFHELLRSRKTILLEGAQGTLLDVDFGTYPYVTSSNASCAGASSGTGIPPSYFREIIGVLKAYTTRIGAGPFPTETPNPMNSLLRDKGEEYGATTGRPRRCGWLDLVATKYAVSVNGTTQIALTKLDVLSKIDPLYICCEYELEGERTKDFPLHSRLLSRVKPVYRAFPGWSKPIQGLTRWEDLPPQAKAYVEFIEEELQVPIKYISTGSSRTETIIR